MYRHRGSYNAHFGGFDGEYSLGKRPSPGSDKWPFVVRKCDGATGGDIGACTADIRKLCPNIQPGEDRLPDPLGG